jgi:hypothetical protein
MPVEIASILRDTQSKTAFETFPSRLKKHVINKKGETLAASEEGHTEEITTGSSTKRVNLAIHHKKQGFIADTESFLSSDPNAEEKIASRDVLVALERGLFLSKPKLDVKTVVGNLIQEAANSEEKKEPASGCMPRIKHRLNERCITLATRELEAGHPLAALTHLEKMKGITREYKKQLEGVKEDVSHETISTPKI